MKKFFILILLFITYSCNINNEKALIDRVTQLELENKELKNSIDDIEKGRVNLPIAFSY